ncbi:MAG: redoxin family protein [Phycisphaeraceae bacterium JB051]
MRIKFQSFCVLLTMFLLGPETFVHAQQTPQTEPLSISQWQTKIIDTYKQLDRYKVHKTIKITQTVDAVSQHDQVDIDIALDRANKQIMVQADRLRMVGKDNILRTQMVPATTSHLHMDNVDPLDPTAIQKAWPMFPVWLWAPDLSLYLGTEVQLYIKSDDFKFSTRDTKLPDSQIEFETKLGGLKMYLTVIKKSGMIRKTLLVAENQTPEGKNVKTEMDYDIKFSLPESWDAKTFVMDVSNSKPVPTVSQMIQDAQSPKALQGSDAPPVVLKTLKDNKTVNIAKLSNKVVVLDFWATWCGPCRRAMPELIEFDQWAKENKLDVAVYTVNIEEEKELVQQFVDQQNMTLPVLMDTDSKVTAAYRAYSIPQTVFIVDGKIERIFQGFSPRVADEWRNVVQQALGVQIESKP